MFKIFQYRKELAAHIKFELRLFSYLFLATLSGLFLYLLEGELRDIFSLIYCLLVSSMTVNCIWRIMRIYNEDLDGVSEEEKGRLKTSKEAGRLLRRHVLLVVLYGYVVVAAVYGLAYHVTESVPKANNFGDYLYFSLITMATVGYGDLVPTGFGRALASCEVLTSMTYQLLAFASASSYFGRFSR